MFSRRIHLLLGVTPAIWLANGCFLGGDYFSERGVASSDTDTTQSDTTATPDPSSVADTSPRPGVPPGPSNSSAAETDSPSEDPAASGVTLEQGSSDDASPPAPTSSELDNATSVPEADPTSGEQSTADAPTDPCSRFGCEEGCEPDERAGPDGRCYWFSTTRMTWTSALNTCADRGQGWTTLTLHTLEEDTFVVQFIETDTWIGAQYSDGTWRWIDDDAPFPSNNSATGDTYANWGTNEPSGAKSENCARYHSYRSTWRWDDAKCNEMFAVACQGPAPN